MSTNFNLTTNLSCNRLQLTTVCFQERNSRDISLAFVKKRRSSQYFWFLIMAVSMITTFHDLFQYSKCYSSRKIVKLFYHAFLCFCKLDAYTVVYDFTKNSHQISHLFNCLQINKLYLKRRQYRPNNCDEKQYNSSEEKHLLFLLISCALAIASAFLICAPAIIVLLPCLHANSIINIFGIKDCNSALYRIYL